MRNPATERVGLPRAEALKHDPRHALEQVKDPDMGTDIVSSGFVGQIKALQQCESSLSHCSRTATVYLQDLICVIRRSASPEIFLWSLKWRCTRQKSRRPGHGPRGSKRPVWAHRSCSKATLPRPRRPTAALLQGAAFPNSLGKVCRSASWLLN